MIQEVDMDKIYKKQTKIADILFDDTTRLERIILFKMLEITESAFYTDQLTQRRMYNDINNL